MIEGVTNKAFKKLKGSIEEKAEHTVASSVDQTKKVSKDEYLKALEMLKSRDRVGVAGEVLATFTAGAGGVAAAGTLASAAGATTLLGSSTLGTILGGIFVTSTPVGWVIGCAVAAASMGYGVTKLVKSGQKGDSSREKHRGAILEKIKTEEKGQAQVYDDFIELIKSAVGKEVITRDTSIQLIGLVDDGYMDVQVAIDRISRLLKPST